MILYNILLVTVVCGVMGQNKPETDQTTNEVEDDGNWKLLYRLLTDCAKTADIGVCLKMKAVTFLDRAVSLKTPLLINDYVSLARDPKYKETSPEGRSIQPLSETQLEESLPRTAEERSGRLDEMLQEKLNSFLHSRILQLNFPADVFEGRKKKKGEGYMMAAGVAMAAMMGQMFMGKIALIAGKALLVAKIALVISAVVGLKKLVGSGGGDSHPQVVYASGGHEHGMWHGRSIASDHLQAHDMAYRAHRAENASDK